MSSTPHTPVPAPTFSSALLCPKPSVCPHPYALPHLPHARQTASRTFFPSYHTRAMRCSAVTSRPLLRPLHSRDSQFPAEMVSDDRQPEPPAPVRPLASAFARPRRAILQHLRAFRRPSWSAASTVSMHQQPPVRSLSCTACLVKSHPCPRPAPTGRNRCSCISS